MNALDALFRPRSLAVIGASRTPRTIGWQLCDNVIRGGFDGQLFPVNPRYAHVHSIKCWPSVSAIPDQVDLAVVAVRADDVLGVAQACADKGVRGLVVMSAGFTEVGGDGIDRQQALVDLCRDRGMRLIGPNCMGIVNTEPNVRLNATFARSAPLPGNVAFMSQSGALGEAILANAQRLGLGISMFASVGNRADVGTADLLRYWADDPRTDVVLLYLESFGDPAAFLPAVKALSRKKPVVAVKAGRSAAGRRAVSSHTGALAGPDVTTEALFAQCGVLRARTVDELFDLGRALASQPRPKGRRVAVVTNAGGPGALAADALVSDDLELPELAESTRTRIASEVAFHATVANPTDLTATANARHYDVAMTAALEDPNVDAVLVIFVPPIVTDASAVLEAIDRASCSAPDKPVLACLMGGTDAGHTDAIGAIGARRIPVYSFPESAAAAFDALATHAEWRSSPVVPLPDLPDVQSGRAQAVLVAAHLAGRKHLTADESLAVLSAYGVPIVPSLTVASPHAARRAGAQLGYPVALKISSSRLLHKTDVRGVVLDLADGDALEAELLRMAETLASQDPDLAFVVQPMVEGGLELIAGIVTDPQFGPLVMFGLGGTQAEILRDVAFRLTPLTRPDAEALLDTLRASALLGPFRGRAAIDRERLIDLLLRLGRLATDFPEIAELDVNPLLAFPDPKAFRAVDARIALSDDLPPTR